MNARQKAKKYKRMYETLLRQPIQFKVEQHKIDRLKFERYYPKGFITLEDKDYLREVMVRDVTQSLAESLAQYIDYDVEFCPHRNMYRIVGEIKVVDKNYR